MNTEAPRAAGPVHWGELNRPVIVAVLGDAELARLADDVGIRLSHFATEEAFREAEGQVTAEAYDAVVVAFEPWPDVDGVALAQGLRRRCVGTVVVGRAGHQFLLQERLSVVPPSATATVRRWDLQAAIAVAAQETWALAPMRDPWADPNWPDEITEEALPEPDVVEVRPVLPPPPPAASQIRQADDGSATRSTMIQLFGDELVAPPVPQASPVPSVHTASGPSWAREGTREWAPSGTTLAKLAQGAEDSVRRQAALPEIATLPDGRPPERVELAESDHSTPPAPRPRRVHGAQRVAWLLIILSLGLLTAVLARAVWLR